MIKLALQFFAKSASDTNVHGQSMETSKYTHGSAGSQNIQSGNNKKEEDRPKGKTKGESVTAVVKSAVYEVYLIDHGREVLVGERLGSDIIKKMIYRQDRGGWISNKKGLRYNVRRKI